jgi:6-phosphogluconate dehydrogenase
MTEVEDEYGVVGLGRMGGNLSRQALEKGIRVVGFTRHGAPPDMIEAGLVEVRSYEDLKAELAPPRAIFIYIPAGPPVDKVLDDLAAQLDEGDVLVDGGNSYWGDSIRRYHRLKEQGIRFVDLGTSGGVDGARHGACFMAGGEPEAIARIEPILLDLATDTPDLREPGTSRSSSTTGSSSGCSRPSGRAWTYSNITVTGSTSLRF